MSRNTADDFFPAIGWEIERSREFHHGFERGRVRVKHSRRWENHLETEEIASAGEGRRRNGSEIQPIEV